MTTHKNSYGYAEIDFCDIEQKEDDNCFKKIFDEAYNNYNKARLNYFNTINLVRNFKKNELC